MTRDTPILNCILPARPWLDPRARTLPGIAPIAFDDWLWVLDSYPGQMALKERLLRECPDRVLAMQPGAGDAAHELLDLVLDRLDAMPGFERDRDDVACPDGRTVRLDRDAPLAMLGRLVQEDLCVLQKPDGQDEHLLTGALLCFPASWTLAEKIGRPMGAIHVPVAAYDARLAVRVQRLLDGVQPGRPIARCNALFYDDPSLFQPRSEEDPRPAGGSDAPFFRSERQCLLRLPQTRAVVFSIHTILLRRGNLTAEDLAQLDGGGSHAAE